MNPANRKRQTEMERQLWQVAEMRNARHQTPSVRMKVKWAAIGAAVISLMGMIAFVVIGHAR